jgi:hypothetical protein
MSFKWFHPFNFLVYTSPSAALLMRHQYGFSLDLTTEMYYYTYDWGKGFNFRILGWGFEITKVGI